RRPWSNWRSQAVRNCSPGGWRHRRNEASPHAVVDTTGGAPPLSRLFPDPAPHGKAGFRPMNVVVVESPAKAKTINKYLGSGYKVLASYGHVRDLPSKDGSVRPDEDFAMDWEVEGKAAKRLSEIAEAVKGADRLILATDPDREGEAISWHVLEVLQKKR